MARGDRYAEVVVLRDGAEVASWALACAREPDLDVVNDLARLQLEAGRLGCTIWLRTACPDLLDLLDLVGLAGVVAGPAARPVGPLQVGREAKGGEQLGVEEVVVPDDPVA